jgi:hypothetical protein
LQESASLLLLRAAAAVKSASCQEAPVGLRGKPPACCTGVPHSIVKGSCGSICCSAGTAARCCCWSETAGARRGAIPEGLMLRDPLISRAPATIERRVSLPACSHSWLWRTGQLQELHKLALAI